MYSLAGSIFPIDEGQRMSEIYAFQFLRIVTADAGDGESLQCCHFAVSNINNSYVTLRAREMERYGLVKMSFKISILVLDGDS